MELNAQDRHGVSAEAAETVDEMQGLEVTHSPAPSSRAGSDAAGMHDSAMPSHGEENTDSEAGPSNLSQGLSKNQQKKLARKAKFEAVKAERRQAERQRRREKKKEAAAQRRVDLANGVITKEQLCQEKTQAPGEPYNINVVIDLAFDELMREKEIVSMGSQVGHLYSSQRHAKRPVSNLYLVGHGSHPGSSFAEQRQLDMVPKAHAPVASRKIADTELGKRMEVGWRGAWRRWKHLTVLEEGGIEDLVAKDDASASEESELPLLNEMGGKLSHAAFKAVKNRRLRREDVIYLTADSSTTLDVLEEGKTFVIGGIVDKNRYKGLCARKAEQLGYATARLPIDDENLQLADGQHLETRKVLTVNQVFDILLGWCETKSWPEALARAFPMRKLPKQKQEQEGDSNAESAPMSPSESSHADGAAVALPVGEDEDDLFNSR